MKDQKELDRINPSIYSMQEKMLNVASKYFDENVTSMKGGLYGYMTEALGMVHNIGITHRSKMYDESFKSTAALPSSLNRFATWQKWEIPQATPAIAKITLIIDHSELQAKIIKFGSVTISREDVVDIGGFPFAVPYDVIINYKNDAYEVRYATEASISPLTPDIGLDYVSNPFIQFTINPVPAKNNALFLYLYLDVYQYELTNQKWEMLNPKDVIDKSVIFEGTYKDQLVKFDVYHNGTLIQKLFDFNANSLSEYCHYSYSDEHEVTILFDYNNPKKPKYGSLVQAQYCTSMGAKGNFEYTGDVYFQFKNNNLQDLEVFTYLRTNPAGGNDKMSMAEIKEYLNYLDLTRESIVTEYDLQQFYTKSMQNVFHAGNHTVDIFKSRDDILKRVFSIYLLLSDKRGNIVPTTTKSIVIPKSYLEKNNNLIKIKTLFKVDAINKTVVIVTDPEDKPSNEFGKFYYYLPYFLNVSYDPIQYVDYISTICDKNIALKFIPINKVTNDNTRVVLNNVNIKHNPVIDNFYKLSIQAVLFNLESFGDSISSKLRAKVKIINAAGNALGGFTSYWNKETSSFDMSVESYQYFDNRKLKLKDIENADGTIGDVFVDEYCSFDIYIEADFSDTETPQWELITNYVSISTNQLFFTILNDVCKSELIVNRTVDNASIESFTITDVPFIGVDYADIDTNLTDFMNDAYASISIMKESLNRLENNTELDFKFFNTFGISQRYNIDFTNIKVSINIKFKSDFDQSTIHLIKTHIIDYITQSAVAGNTIISFSDIVTILMEEVPEILYIIPDGFNGNKDLDVIEPINFSNNIQQNIKIAPERLMIHNLYKDGVNTDQIQINIIS